MSEAASSGRIRPLSETIPSRMTTASPPTMLRSIKNSLDPVAPQRPSFPVRGLSLTLLVFLCLNLNLANLAPCDIQLCCCAPCSSSCHLDDRIIRRRRQKQGPPLFFKSPSEEDRPSLEAPEDQPSWEAQEDQPTTHHTHAKTKFKSSRGAAERWWGGGVGVLTFRHVAFY